MEFNKIYGPYALQLYLYLAKNADNYNLALSAQAAENEAGIKRTTFHKYVNLLIAEGYLVWRRGNIYDFYETPQEIRRKRPPHGEEPCAWNDCENPSCDFESSQDDQECPQADIEINTIYKDNKKIEEKIREQEADEEEISQESKATWDGFVF